MSRTWPTILIIIYSDQSKDGGYYIHWWRWTTVYSIPLSGMTACLWCTLHHRVIGWYILYLWLWVGTVAGLSYIIYNLDNKPTYMHNILIMNDIIIHNYSILYNRWLLISILPPLQAVNLVIHLKILNATITPTLASNI